MLARRMIDPRAPEVEERGASARETPTERETR